MLRPVALLALALVVVACGGREADSENDDAGADAAHCTSPYGYGLGGGGSPDGGVGPLTIDANYVYWANYSEVGRTRRTAIQRASKAGGEAAQDLALPCPDVQCWPTLAIDDTRIYFTGADASGVSVSSVGKSGGAATTLASGLVARLAIGAIDANAIYLASSNGVAALSKEGGPLAPVVAGEDVTFLGIDDANVYWTSTDAIGTLNATPKSGGSTTTLAVLSGIISTFAFDAENFYVGGGYVQSPAVPLDGIYVVSKASGAQRLLASGNQARGILVAGATLYAGEERVMAIDLQSAAVTTTVASGMGEIETFAVDDDDIYIGSNGDLGGEIRKFCRYATMP